MSLSAAAIQMMVDKGLSGQDIADVAAANELKADPTNAQRQARFRANKKEREAEERNAVTVTRYNGSPNDNILTPSVCEKPKPKGLVKKFAFPAPDGVPEPTWSDFLTSPKRKKAGMSATAYAGICSNLTRLAEAGYPPGEMIALAVERGWTTVKLDWVKNEERSQRHERPDNPLAIAVSRLAAARN